MSRSLLKIFADEQALFELLDEVEGQITPESEGAIDQFFAEIEFQKNAKIDSYCNFITQKLGEAEILKKEADRLSKKAKAAENLAKRLKDRLEFFLRQSGGEPIKTTFNTIKLENNGGKTPVILDEYYAENPVDLPERYRKVEFKVDMDQIRIGLENPDTGEEITFARLGEKGTHLKIR